MVTTLNDKVDSAFGIALIILFLVCIVMILVKGVFASGDIDAISRGINSAVGGGGASGAAILYMKWKVIRGMKVKEGTAQDVKDLLAKDDKE